MVINQYDRCVSKKIINGNQCTIFWYIDDNKLSYINPKVITNVLEVIEGHFETLVVHKDGVENEFDFLGIGITTTEDKRIKIERKE